MNGLDQLLSPQRMPARYMSSNSDPIHKPLSSTSCPIRLLQRGPSIDVSTIQIRLVEADFRDARYNLVSYSFEECF